MRKVLGALSVGALLFLCPRFTWATTPTNVQFTAASSTTVNISWTLDSPGAEAPLIVLSTTSNFSVNLASMTGAVGLQTTAYAVTDNTTFYFEVKVSTEADSTFSAAISTVNAARIPSDIIFDAVSTSAVTASAYVSLPGFSNLNAGNSGIDVAIDGVYSAYHVGGNTWTYRTSMSLNRTEFGAAVAGGKIYVMGGTAGTSPSTTGKEVESYDPVTNSWATNASLPTARNSLCAAAVNGKIYAIGGLASISGGNLSTNEEYDPVGNTWVARASMPTARSSMACAAIGGKIYAIGGTNGLPTGANEQYDPSKNAWTSKTSMPTARQELAAAPIRDKIYAVGGNDGSSALSKNEEYNPGADTWATKASLPSVRRRLGAATAGGKLYAVGGFNAVYLSANDAYDPIVDQWTSRAPLNTSRQSLSAVSLYGIVYALGGAIPGYDTALNEAFDPGIAASFGGLQPNSLHGFKAKARNAVGAETAESAVVSTYTLAAIEAPAGSVFTGVSAGGLTVNYSSGDALGGYNPLGTQYLVEVATSADFFPISASSLTANAFASFNSGIDTTVNTYFARVTALNTANIGNILSLGSLLVQPGPPIGVSTFTGLGSFGFTVHWASGTQAGGFNPPNTRYRLQVATTPAFSLVSASSDTANIYATPSVQDNSTYYAQVAVLSDVYVATPYTTLGATFTPVATPTSIVFDEVFAASITASAYAITPAFSNLDQGQSGVNIALNGVYNGYRTANKWATKAVMTTARYYLAVVQSGGLIYALGGTPDGSTRLNANEVYDPVTNSWSSKATSGFTPRYGLAAAAVSGKIYAIGGNTGVFSGLNEVYDPASNTWSSKASMLTSRQMLVAAAVNNKIYAIGGYNGGAGLSTNEQYDPVADAWSSVAGMPTGRSGMAAAAAGGKIYVIGGLGPLNNNEAYDPAANSWAVNTNLPTSRQYAAAAELSGKIYVLGGAAPSTVNINEEYDPAAAAWVARGPMTTARYGLGAAQFGSKIYAVGGAGGAGNENEEFDSGDAVRFTGLTPNTLYAFKAKARSTFGAETAESTVISTYTLAITPGLPVISTFTNISSIGLRVNWSSGSVSTGYNAVGVQYIVQLSTNSNFSQIFASSTTANTYASFSALTPDTKAYYARVASLNQGNAQSDWLTLGSISSATVQFGVGLISGTNPSTTNGIAWGDANNDGLLDLAVSNDGANHCLYLRNNGDGTFTKTILASSGTRGVAWGDYDNDGYLDLAFAAGGGNPPQVLHNNRDGTFALTSLTAAGGDGRGIAWGDLNNDGLLDLVISYGGGQDAVIMYNNGGGTFTKKVITGSGTGANLIGVALADYNGDGYLDIALSNYGGNQILYKNNGDGTFTQIVLAGSTSNANAVAWADYNGDGRPDLAVSNDSGDSFVMRNNGDGTFTKTAFTNTGGGGGNTIRTLAWGDYNNDGAPDLVLGNAAGNSLLMRNNGDGTFTLESIDRSGIVNSGVSLGDYNNDGSLDLAVGNNDNVSKTELLRNDFASTHSSPTAPSSGFSATFTEYAVFSSSGILTLNWAGGSDAKTPAASLNYYVRVGTSSANNEILKVPQKYSPDGYSGGGSFLYSTQLTSSQRGLKLNMQKETTAYWAVTAENLERSRSSESGEQTIKLVAPAVTTNLGASQDGTIQTSSSAWVTLTFTSPGENGAAGALQSGAVYDIRWSTFPINTQTDYLVANYQQLVPANGPAAGSAITLSIAVEGGRTYYFAMTTKNSSGVRSPLSNTASAAINALQYTVTALNPGTYLEGQTTAYLMLQMWTDGGNVQWRGLSVGKIGTLPDAAVQLVGIFKESNGNTSFDGGGTDFQTSANTVFVSSKATLTLLGGSGELINASTKTYYVAVGLQPNYLPVDGSTIAVYLDGMVFTVSSGGVRSPDYPALSFNTANRVFLGYNATLNQTTGLTVEAWARSTMTYSGTNINVLDRSGGNYATGYNLGFERAVCPTAGAPSFDTGGGNTICAPFLINDGRWHHVAGTYDSVLGRKLFIDGLLVSTAVAAGALNDTTDGLAVGGAIGSGTAFTGDIDEVRISTFARYYQSFIPTRRFTSDGGTTLLYHFGIQLATQTLVNDYSANGNNGTVQSGVLIPALSQTATAKQRGTILYSTTTDISPAVFTRGAANTAVLKLQLWTAGDFVTLNGATVERAGSAGDAAVNAVRILADNGNGVYESGVDPALTADQVFSNGYATFNFVTAGTAQLIGSTTQIYWIAMDVAPGAIAGTTLALRISSSTNFALSGSVSTMSPTGLPAASSARTIVAALTNVLASVSTGTWVNVSTIDFRGGFAADNVDHYYYLWNQSVVTTINGTESYWSSGTLNITPPTDANNWYLHVKGYDATGSSGTQIDLGPYWFDRSSPTASGYQTLNSTGGVVNENGWSNLASGATAQIAVQDALAGLAVSTGTLSYGVIYSTTAGQSWVDWSTFTIAQTAGTDALSLAVFNNTLFAGTWPNAKIFSSGDGVSWSQAVGLPGLRDVNALASFNGKLYAAAGDGVSTAAIYASSDTVTWNQSTSISGPADALALAVFDGKLYAGTSGQNVYSTADGIVWNHLNAALGNGTVSSLVVFNGSLYAGASGPGSAISIYQTSDGAIWNLVFNSASETAVQLGVDNGKIFAGTDQGSHIYQSSDGRSWTLMYQGAANTQVNAFLSFNGKLYAATKNAAGGQILARINASSWVPVFTDAAADRVTALAAFNGKLQAGLRTNGRVARITPLPTSTPALDGDAFLRTYSGNALSLVASTNAAVCGGVFPCGASNQVIFSASDLAGNARVAGPFSVLVDTMSPLAMSTAGAPGNGIFVSTQPNFSWTGPSTPTMSGLGAGASYVLQVSSGDPAFGGANIVVNISTPVAVNPSSTTADALYISTYTLNHGATYYWHVRSVTALGGYGPWSLTSSFVTDFSTPTAALFATYNSTGGYLSEIQWNNLASPVTAQISIRDPHSGLAVFQSPSFQVLYSTTGGVQFQQVNSTVPSAGPYISVTGAPGSQNAEIMKVYNLGFPPSTNNAVCGGGSGPCGATNQIFFTFSDRAGNTTTAGPYAVLVDTFTQLAMSTTVFPVNGSFVNATPNFNWNGPSTATVAGVPGGQYLLQVSSNDAAFAQSNVIFSIAVNSLVPSSSAATSNGAYISTMTLNEGATYYWRVAERSSFGNIGPWSAISSFVGDYTNPSASAYVSINSTGGAVGEAQFNNVAANASAQISVRDAFAGLQISTTATKAFGVVYSTVAGQNWIDGAWASMGSPIAGETHILSMAVYNGKLYAGTRPNGKVAVFDGNSWSATNGNSSIIGGETDVMSLAVYNGLLYAGTAPNGKVAAFDGNNWSVTSGGSPINATETQVNALAAFDGKLYAGTSPNGKVAMFDGTNWVATANNGPVLPGESNILALAVFNGKLYAGTAPNGKVTSFDGNGWTAANGNTAVVAGETQIRALAAYGKKLYAGTFPNAKIGIYDGFSWTANSTVIAGEAYAQSLAVFGGRLYAGTGSNAKVAVYDGTSWSAGNSGGPPISGENFIEAMAAYNGMLYAGTASSGRVAQLTPVTVGLGAATDGATTLQTLLASNLSLAPSTTAQTCGGAACSATNQIKFSFLDRAGNAANAGPFAIIVDSAPPAASITSLTPANTSIVATATGTDNFSGVRDYNFEASSSPAFAFAVSSSNFIAAANYAFAGLVQGTTYFVRVTSRDNAFNLSPASVSAATSTIGTIIFSSAAMAPANALQSTEAAMLKVKLQTPPGSNATFLNMRIRETGSAADGDLTSVKVYLDVPNTGVFDASQDIQLGAAAMSGGAAFVNLGSNAQSIDSTGKTFFVVYNVNPQANVGSTLGAEITSSADIGFSFPFSASSPFPTDSALSTIQNGANNLNFSPVNTAPATAPPGSTDIPLLKLIAQTSSGTSVLQSMQLHLTGNVPSNSITAVRIYRDANSNGIFDAGDALVTNGSDIFLNGVSTLTFTAIQSSRTVTPAQAFYFVTVNLSGTATPGNTFGVQITSATDTLLSTPLDTVVYSVSPMASGLTSVAANNGVNVNVTASVPAAFAQGSSYAVLMASATVDAGVAQLNRFSVNRLGASSDADLTASVYLHPAADGLPWNPSVDVLLGSSTFSGGKASVAITTTTLNAGTTSIFYVVYNVGPTANPGDTLGAGMTNNAYVGAVSGFTSVFINAPVNSSTSPVVAGTSRLLVAPQDQTSGAIAQGAANSPVLRLTVGSDFNPISWAGVTVTRLGTGPDSDVKAVKIFRDADANGVLDGADALVTSGTDKFFGGSAIVAFTAPQNIAVATQTYFVALDLDPNAIAGDGIGVRISTSANFNLNSPNRASTTTAFPIDAGPVPIQQFANTVTVTTASIAPAGANIGAKDIGLLKLSLNTNVSQAQWLSLRLDRGGGSSDADIAAVKVYYDFNNLGVFDPLNVSQYLLISSTGAAFGSSAPGTVTLNLSTATILSSSPKTYFVAVDISSSAAPTDTVTVRVLDASYITVNAPNTVAPTAFSSNLMTINAPPQLMYMVGGSSAPASVLEGTSSVPMLAIKTWMSGYTGQWTSLGVAQTGSAADSDISRVSLYADDGDGSFDPLADAQLATGTFTNGFAQLSFAAQTITPSTKTFFVVYNISPIAAAGRTAGAAVTSPGAVTLAAPNSVSNLNFPLASANSLILATQNGVMVAFQDKTPASLLQGSTAQVMLSLTMNTTSQAVVWKSINLARNGVSSDSDVTAIRIFKDVNNNGLFDAGDTEITAGNEKFIGGAASVFLAVPQSITVTPSRYFVALDINLFAVSTATIGLTISSSAALGMSFPNYTVNAGFPLATTVIPVSKFTDTMLIAAADLTPLGVNQGAEVPMAKLTVGAQRDFVQWSQLQATKTGTLSDSMVTQVRVYQDANGNGTWDAADVLVGTGTVSAGQGNISLKTLQRLTPTPAVYFVNYVFSAAAPIGATVGISIPDKSFVGVLSPDVVSNANLPFNGALASMLDARTPTIPVVTLDGPYWNSFDSMHFKYLTAVGSGTIVKVQYAIGLTPGGQEALQYTTLTSLATDYLAQGIVLQNSTTYYVSVKATSSLGFTSPAGVSAPILVDFTVPSAPAIIVTPGGGAILAQWSNSIGGLSGIQGYVVEYRMGDSPTWFNAKTGGSFVPFSYSAHSFSPVAIATSDLVTGGSFSITPPPGTVFIQVQAVSDSGVLGNPSAPPVRVLFGALPPGGISKVSNYPNPFDSRKERTTINYTLIADADVTIRIFNIFGGKIKEMTFGAGASGGAKGSNDVPWDGTDDGGRKVAKGMYVAVIQGGGSKVTQHIGVVH